MLLQPLFQKRQIILPRDLFNDALGVVLLHIIDQLIVDGILKRQRSGVSFDTVDVTAEADVILAAQRVSFRTCPGPGR